MSVEFKFFVPGKPATQGSKSYMGKGIMVDSNKNLKYWRSDVRTACQQSVPGQGWDTGQPMKVILNFIFPRPKGHFRSNGITLKPNAPMFPISRLNGDVDKLSRAILDAMTCIAYDDDSNVVDLQAKKSYCFPNETQGAWITVQAMPNTLPLIGCLEQEKNLA